MEKMLTNQEFNALLDDVHIELSTTGVRGLEDGSFNVDDALSTLKIYWKIIKPILKLANIITPPKIHKGINEFISIVDKLCNTATAEDEKGELLERFAIVWGIVKPILERLKDSTPQKADIVIDEVIKIADLLSRS